MKLLKILSFAVIWSVIIYLSISVELRAFISPFRFEPGHFKILLFGGWTLGVGLGIFVFLED